MTPTSRLPKGRKNLLAIAITLSEMIGIRRESPIRISLLLRPSKRPFNKKKKKFFILFEKIILGIKKEPHENGSRGKKGQLFNAATNTENNYVIYFVRIKEIIFYVFNKLAEGYENEVRVYLLYLFNDISLDLFIKNILKLTL